MSEGSTDAPAAGAARRTAEPPQGRGWVTFAGVMLAIAGSLNVVYGIGAIDDAQVFVGETKYVVADLNTWGWFLVLVGVIQLAAAMGIWSGAEWARWIGVLSASANAILQLLFMPAFPLLSLCLFGLDVLVIYGLVQYGGRQSARA